MAKHKILFSFLLIVLLVFPILFSGFSSGLVTVVNNEISVSCDATYKLRAQTASIVTILKSQYFEQQIIAPNGTIIYDQTRTTNMSFQIPANADYGTYTIKSIAGVNTAETKLDVLDISNWQQTTFPYTRTWQNVTYNFYANGSIIATGGNSTLNIDLSFLRYIVDNYGVTATAYSNSMNFRVRFSGGAFLIDLTFAFTYKGCKFIVNGTLDQPRTFQFNLNNTERVVQGITDSFKSGLLVFDYSDFRKVQQAFTIENNTVTISIPQSFSLDPTIFLGAVGSSANDSGTDGVTAESQYMGSVLALNDYFASFRFAGVNVPQGATINYANLTMYETSTVGTPLLKIIGFLQTNTADFSGDDGLARPNTTAKVDWDTITGSSVWVSSPDISSIVQEIVNQVGWASGNALGFKIVNDGGAIGNSARCFNYDFSASYDAEITINYTINYYPYIQQISNIDSSADVGTHGNFSAQQYGPDQINDTLSETSGSSSPSFGNPATTGTSYSTIALNDFAGGLWTSGSTALTVYNITFFASETGSGTRSVKGVICDSTGHILTNGIGNAVTVSGTTQAWYTSTFSTPPTISGSTNYALLLIPDTAGFRLAYSSASGGTQYADTSNSFASPTDPTDWVNTNSTNYRIYANTSYTINYQMKLEEEFTSVPHDGSAWTNGELCIFMGTYTGTAEDLGVQVWNATSSAWTTVSSSLTQNSWNNISVLSYVTSEELYIQFIGGTEEDDTDQNTWMVDTTYLHLWVAGNSYAAELTQAISTTYNQGVQASFKLTYAQGIALTWNVLLKSFFNLIPSLSLTFTWITDIIKGAGAIHYIADLALSFSTSWNVLTKWSAKIVFSQGISTTWNVLLKWSAIATLSNSITITWNMLVKSNFNLTNSIGFVFTWAVDTYKTAAPIHYIADLSLAIATTWNLLTQWVAHATLTQSLTTTWNTLLKWTAHLTVTQNITMSFTTVINSFFHIQPSLTTTFSWAVNVVRGIASVHYIADLSLAFSTIWNIVTKWNATTILTQNVAFTWQTLTKSLFHVNPSLSITFSWLVDLLRTAAPVAYTVDLALSVTFSWTINLIQGLQRTVDLTLTVLFSWNFLSGEPVPLTAIDALAVAILAILCAVTFGFAGPLLMNKRKRRREESE